MISRDRCLLGNWNNYEKYLENGIRVKILIKYSTLKQMIILSFKLYLIHSHKQRIVIASKSSNPKVLDSNMF